MEINTFWTKYDQCHLSKEFSEKNKHVHLHSDVLVKSLVSFLDIDHEKAHGWQSTAITPLFIETLICCYFCLKYGKESVLLEIQRPYSSLCCRVVLLYVNGGNHFPASLIFLGCMVC